MLSIVHPPYIAISNITIIFRKGPKVKTKRQSFYPQPLVCYMYKRFLIHNLYSTNLYVIHSPNPFKSVFSL